MSEANADDGALYSVWDRLTADEVDALHALVAFVGEQWNNGHPLVALVALKAAARLLATFDLGHLPVVRAVLDAS